MIRAWFGLEADPFSTENVTLLAHQQEILDTLLVHSQQGGLCLVIGEPGAGKSVVRHALSTHDTKRLVTPIVTRTLHTYAAILRILGHSCQVETDGSDLKCERRLIDFALNANRTGKMIVPIIDDAHLMDIQALRKLRLLFEEFPKNTNLVLVGQTSLLDTVRLSVNEDIRSRITFSALLKKLAPDDALAFILKELDRVGLGHNTFTEEALSLVVRSSEGVLRRVRNLCLASMLEALRAHKRTVDLAQVNAVLIQPHWRRNRDLDQH